MTADRRFLQRDVTLVSTRVLSPSVRHFTFRTSDDTPFPYAAGQWVGLALDTPEGPQKKAYSIASAPRTDQPGLFELAITKVDGGPLSSALHTLPEGAAARIEGPFGVFTMEDADPSHPVLLVGTGTGVAPLRAMLQADLSDPQRARPIHLLFGCRTEDDILFRQELESLTQTHARFSYTPTLSRPEPSWTNERGYVQTHLPRLVSAMGPDVHVYICGLSKMVHDVREVLRKQLGLERRHVHSERFD